MGLTYLDENGETKDAIMGCYGIGEGRMAASVCEVKHDDYGPIWPISIAPWEIHMCLLRADDAEAKAFADDLYAKMNNKGMEVLYDDREDVRPGAMFADADLIGAPIRVIVGPKNLQEGLVEIVSRDKSISMKVNKDEVIEKVMEIRAEMFAKINEKVVD